MPVYGLVTTIRKITIQKVGGFEARLDTHRKSPVEPFETGHVFANLRVGIQFEIHIGNQTQPGPAGNAVFSLTQA